MSRCAIDYNSNNRHHIYLQLNSEITSKLEVDEVLNLDELLNLLQPFLYVAISQHLVSEV